MPGVCASESPVCGGRPNPSYGSRSTTPPATKARHGSRRSDLERSIRNVRAGWRQSEDQIEEKFDVGDQRLLTHMPEPRQITAAACLHNERLAKTAKCRDGVICLCSILQVPLARVRSNRSTGRHKCRAWRPRPESNRDGRICSPLRNHSATRPLPQRAARVPAYTKDRVLPQDMLPGDWKRMAGAGGD